MSLEPFDYSQFASKVDAAWFEEFQGNSFPEIVLDVLKKCTLLPNADFQIPLLASYLCLNSALCYEVTKWDIPILYCHGDSGTGKSDIGKLLCRIYDQKPMGGGTTFAGLRNEINQRNYWSVKAGDVKGNRKPSCLVWEDIDSKELNRNDGQVFSLLKNGVSKDGTISISMGDGKNMEFSIYGPKAISSIHSLFSYYEFRELIRRLLVIQHKHYSKWEKTDYSAFYGDRTPEDCLSILSYNWEGLSSAYHQYWRQSQTIETFLSVAKSLQKGKPKTFPLNYWAMSKNLIATGVTCGFWNDAKVAIQHLEAYWLWHHSNVAKQVTATEKEIKAFLSEKTKAIIQANAEFEALGMKPTPVEVNPRELKAHLKLLNEEGRLDGGITNREISSYMANLGWVLDGKWRKSN